MKTNLKIKSKSKVRIEGNIEKKVVQLHEQIQKLFLNLTLTPKIAVFDPKAKSDQRVRSETKVIIEGSTENKS